MMIKREFCKAERCRIHATLYEELFTYLSTLDLTLKVAVCVFVVPESVISKADFTSHRYRLSHS